MSSGGCHLPEQVYWSIPSPVGPNTLSPCMRDYVDRRAFLIAADALAAIAAAYIGVWLRFGASANEIWSTLALPPLWVMAGAFGVLTFLSFAAAGIYRAEIYWDLRPELADLAKGITLLGFTSLATLFLFKMDDVSRISIAIAFITLSVAVVSTRLLNRTVARRMAREGKTLRTWLVVGSSDQVVRLNDSLREHAHVGASVIGYVAESDVSGGDGHWVGTIYDLPEILRHSIIDEVIISGLSNQKELEAVLSVCAEQGKTVRLSMDSIAPTALKGRLEEYDGVPMWSILSTPGHALELALKRILDLSGAFLGLLVLSPLLLVTSLAIVIAEGRPILFVQRRSGLHGREFKMLKFRTMVNGAEFARNGLVHVNERSGPVFKIRNDPRITRVGRWLRKTSIDEAPQLVNVLLGHMSLVGPRPQPLEEVAQYDLWHRRRLSMRPGITGLWQIKARHDPSFDTWMDNDLEYIDRWSLLLDLSILIRTPRAIVRYPGD